MGLFDAPAFARRGQELEETLRRLHERCRQARAERLDMVHVRLRQWARAVTGPEAWSTVFAASIEPLWPLSEAEPPQWAGEPAPIRRQLDIARDLIAAVVRFNHRWVQFLDGLKLEAANHGDRPVQSLLCPGEGVRDGLGPTRRPVLHARAQALPRTCSFAIIRSCPSRSCSIVHDEVG